VAQPAFHPRQRLGGFARVIDASNELTGTREFGSTGWGVLAGSRIVRRSIACCPAAAR